MKLHRLLCCLFEWQYGCVFARPMSGIGLVSAYNPSSNLYWLSYASSASRLRPSPTRTLLPRLCLSLLRVGRIDHSSSVSKNYNQRSCSFPPSPLSCKSTWRRNKSNIDGLPCSSVLDTENKSFKERVRRKALVVI